jgi:hypothetical protein
MAGTETNGYDLVIEFAERACQDIVSAFFDSDGLLSDLLDAIGVPSSVADAFSVVLAFDRPSGVPASNPDVVDIAVLLGEGGTGSRGRLRIVAGVAVDASPERDLARIDLANRLHRTELEIVGLPGTANTALNLLFRNRLRDNVRSIPLVPIPVDRASTSPTAIIAGDARVVDDTSAADADALAFLVTFGGGTAGNRAGFTRSFLAGSDTGGVAIGFGWLCRVVSPLIDSSLNLGGAFTNCALTRTVRIDEDEGVDLTALSLTLDDGFIRVSATVRKTGFCYEATGRVSARIRMEVSGGRLNVVAEVDDPDIDVDIPWYCWLAGAVIGAIVAGVIGAVLVPVIMYIAQEAVEGTINSVAQRVADAVNSLDLNTSLPVPGVNIVFQRVFIDDITIACTVAVDDRVPIRSEGIVRLTPGSAVDLDSGRVGKVDLPSADVACEGFGFGRTLRAVCGARLARTDRNRFDGFTRSTAYRYRYAAPNPIPLDELARLDPFGLLFGDPFDEHDRVYAVRTNEGRYSIIQAIEVDLGVIVLRYRTWEKRVPTLEIRGEFRCEGIFDIGSAVLDDVRFVPSKILRPTPAAETGATTTPVAEDPCIALTGAVQSMLPADAVRARSFDAIAIEDRRIGRWVGTVVRRSTGVGRFDAATQGIAEDASVRWAINEHAIGDGEGEVQVGDATVAYEAAGKRLVVRPKTESDLELLLTATVVDATQTLTTQRCVRYEHRCTSKDVRQVPTFREYQTAWRTHFGVVEVPVPVPDPGPITIARQAGGGGGGGRR